MSMPAQKFAEYLRRGGVTQEQLGQTLSSFAVDDINARTSTVNEVNARASGLTAEDPSPRRRGAS